MSVKRIQLENTEANRKIANVAANLACSGMYLDEEMVEELQKVNNGEKTTEQLIAEMKEKYQKKIG